jgi:hypothetical protein
MLENQSENSKNHKNKELNGFAIAGLVMGIIGIFSGSLGIAPILAIVFSSIGLSKTEVYRGSGKVTSWIGLILGILYTIVFINSIYNR